MPILILAWKSLLNRRVTALLTMLSIALSVTLLLGVERLRTEARASFASTISGTDLIVGARTGPVQLLLYSVFRIGDATNNISWRSYQDIAELPGVAWSVPLSLGDSHRGYRVLGTTQDYFERYHYGRDHPLAFAKGKPFSDLFDAVLGAEVATKLGYRVGDAIIVAHGAADVSFARHDDKPFRVSGILAPTGTPVDQTVHVSLEAIEAIHLGWEGGAPTPGQAISAQEARAADLTPETITAALIGLESKIATFQVQRAINTYPQEPLLAILPGVALSQLWSLIAMAENALRVVSAFVVLVGLVGMLTALLTSLNERRREMAILRSVGARPWHIFALIMGETGALMLLGMGSGLGLLYAMLLAAQPLLQSAFGISITLGAPPPGEWLLLASLLAAGVLVGAIPAYLAYRRSLIDGLSIRL
ncbi:MULTISPECIES: ABC transporter permease [Thiorhodovibrio]|uniref:ABC transporter permease n=1 Tax=Thiorhodovibrio TaxID=61593 RepID=UPI0019120A18|nr:MULTISPECIES: ABC transporter permease [Thiorhodovibrio]MBK5970490.1 peptide ABC transporter permease [Thiorhodovibrio winogradskyi]WPL12511.1 lipoprotein releasing system, transmembrane protein, LolC/E family [Thiorhodovibrio litoralis]